MIFEAIPKPEQNELAIHNSAQAILDYQFEIREHITYWRTLRQETKRFVDFATGLLLQNSLEPTFDDYMLAGSLEQEPLEHQASYICGLLALSSLIRLPELSITSADYSTVLGNPISENTQQNPYFPELHYGGKPKLHILISEAEQMRIPLPKPGQRPRWSKQNNLYLEVTRPASMSQKLSSSLQKATNMTPKNLVTLSPFIQTK